MEGMAEERGRGDSDGLCQNFQQGCGSEGFGLLTTAIHESSSVGGSGGSRLTGCLKLARHRVDQFTRRIV